MTDPKYRQAAYEAAKERRVVERIARQRRAKNSPNMTIKANGHVVPHRERETRCEMCPTVFKFVMTSKPYRFCPECRTEREKQRLARRWGTP